MKLSFVIPVYNAEKYLDECLSSLVKAGEGFDVEFILVNDGSQDTSLEICRSYEAEDNRFRVIDQANQGSQAARNTGIRIAVGDYICFVDSDDYVASNLIGDLLYVIDGYSPDIVLYDAEKFFPDGKKVDVIHDIDSGFYSESDYSVKLLPNLFVTHDLYGNRKVNCTLWSKSFRRDILLAVIDEFDCSIEVGEDLGISAAAMMKASTAYKIGDAEYYNYRDNSSSIMNRYKKNFWTKSEDLCDYLNRQNNERNEAYTLGVAYERCFFAISSYYNEYFFKSDRTSSDRRNAVHEILDSVNLEEALSLIDFSEVRNPNRLILKLLKEKSLATLSNLGNFIYFLSPLLRKVIRI